MNRSPEVQSRLLGLLRHFELELQLQSERERIASLLEFAESNELFLEKVQWLRETLLEAPPPGEAPAYPQTRFYPEAEYRWMTDEAILLAGALESLLWSGQFCFASWEERGGDPLLSVNIHNEAEWLISWIAACVRLDWHDVETHPLLDDEIALLQRWMLESQERYPRVYHWLRTVLPPYMYRHPKPALQEKGRQRRFIYALTLLLALLAGLGLFSLWSAHQRIQQLEQKLQRPPQPKASQSRTPQKGPRLALDAAGPTPPRQTTRSPRRSLAYRRFVAPRCMAPDRHRSLPGADTWGVKR